MSVLVTVPVWAQAGGWGLVSGSALVVGAAIAWKVPVPRVIIAAVMAFGAGVLIYNATKSSSP